MLGAALRKNGFDTPIAQFLPACFGVLSAVSSDDLRLLQRATADTTDGWNRVNERHNCVTSWRCAPVKSRPPDSADMRLNWLMSDSSSELSSLPDRRQTRLLIPFAN